MTRVVSIGGKGITKKILIGGENPVTIQTMWKESITDLTIDKNKLESVLNRIKTLNDIGCDIIRFAVPDMESAKSLNLLSTKTEMPLVADIHFDYKLALECTKANIAKIRINPGNIGSFEKVKAVVDACKEKNIAIRIGVNSGSLPKDLVEKVNSKTLSRSQALVEAALRECEVFEKLNFKNYVVSMKASTVDETIEANELFSNRVDVPLHIGVTEAGPLIIGVVKSTMALTALLKNKIGSTIRISLSDSPENEVITGREILHQCGLKENGVSIISCPRCGRLGFDVHSFVERWQNELLKIEKNLTIAVMGCVVNGPGEGKHADLGITGCGNKAIIFKKGEIIHTIDMNDADNYFRKELDLLIND